jgi:alkylhydroperoxidase/carboxymuconolactone decarboxylase family protein YurZ
MRDIHPVLDKLMVRTSNPTDRVLIYKVDHGYGRVMSRPGLDLPLRELCVVAVLSGQHVEPQLESHLRGALR